VRISSGRLPGCPDVSREQLFSRVHAALKYLLRLIPSASSTLSPIINSKFPQSDDTKKAHLVYIENLIRLYEYAPELKSDIFALITDRLVKIDVQTQVDLDELDDETRSQATSLSMKTHSVSKSFTAMLRRWTRYLTSCSPFTLHISLILTALKLQQCSTLYSAILRTSYFPHTALDIHNFSCFTSRKHQRIWWINLQGRVFNWHSRPVGLLFYDNLRRHISLALSLEALMFHGTLC
jgi:hypothetical protein